MDPEQASPLPVQTQVLAKLIAPPQVWAHLTPTQQEHTFQTIILVCQALLHAPQQLSDGEVEHE